MERLSWPSQRSMLLIEGGRTVTSNIRGGEWRPVWPTMSSPRNAGRLWGHIRSDNLRFCQRIGDHETTRCA